MNIKCFFKLKMPEFWQFWPKLSYKILEIPWEGSFGCKNHKLTMKFHNCHHTNMHCSTYCENLISTCASSCALLLFEPFFLCCLSLVLSNVDCWRKPSVSLGRRPFFIWSKKYSFPTHPILKDISHPQVNKSWFTQCFFKMQAKGAKSHG